MSCEVSQCFGIDTSLIEPIGKVVCVMTAYKIVAEKFPYYLYNIINIL